MVFSSPIFLFLFLPLALLFTLVFRRKYQNIILLAASLVFYAWGGPYYALILLFSILLNYFTGRLVDKHKTTGKGRLYLGIGIALNLSVLVLFKYANFLVDNINILLSGVGLSPIKIIGISLPIGISFFTFQAISYIVDIYRNEARVQKNIANIGLYISLFPQLIAGPIVRYHDIAEQLVSRRLHIRKFASGVERFIIGLAKKVLIANTVAAAADEIFAMSPDSLTFPLAWLGIICYTFQIYFDFAGYSDMAIGLGRMFGFEILENFNFPYISKSIREFWRRWHISLSNWFRDYLYIPLGGNRVSSSKVYLNLFLVFVLTGFWHGASWSFIVWGLIHGVFMILERIGFEKFLTKIWTPFRHLYVLLVVIVAWVFFRVENIGEAFRYTETMFSFNFNEGKTEDLLKYLNSELIVVFILACISSTRIFVIIEQFYLKIEDRFTENIRSGTRLILNITGVVGLPLYFFNISIKT